MSKKNAFLDRLESKIRKQIKGDRVGFLLGAGSSYLDGDGYPLAGELWDKIKPLVPKEEREDIDAKLLKGADGLEHALDLLDSGGVEDKPHRHVVTEAIAQHFCTIRPPPELHGSFVIALQKRHERAIPIFSLNYDPLIERACEGYLARCIDGFIGFEQAYFDPATFQQEIVVVRRGAKGLLSRSVSGVIKLFKLHGSLGWYECPTNGIRRCLFDADIPKGAKRLMIPPQHRKATDTMTPPYAQLWSEFRGMLRQGPILINRLISIGYGMRDEHVNAVIENGLARGNFNLVILARDLDPDAFSRWSKWENAIVVTNSCCSMNGEIGPGHPDLWSFERASKEI